MENRRFTLAKQQSLAKMDCQIEEGKSGKGVILIRKQSSGSVGSRDSIPNNDDRISGFIYIGKKENEPKERIRPELSKVVSYWEKF